MKRFVVGLILTLLAVTTAWAQGNTGRLRGRVTDETGAALPGVTVQVRGAMGEPRQVRLPRIEPLPPLSASV